MLDVGWSEMALILLVALVVIGPKDLPRVARTVGKWTAKARSMAREFQRSFDDMAREAELQDLKAELQKVSRTDLRKELENTLDPDGEMKRALAPPVIDPPRILPQSPVEAPAVTAGEPPDAPPVPEPATPAPALPVTEPARPVAEKV